MNPINGIFPAAPLSPVPCGLLSVANIYDSSVPGYDEKWLRGFSYEFETAPSVSLIALNNATVTNGAMSTADDTPRYERSIPFGITVLDTNSALDALAEDRIGRGIRQITAVTQKALEYELWAGNAATADANSNDFLTNAATVTTVTTAGVAPLKALALLEESIANAPTGVGGIIHMTRDVAVNLTGINLMWVDGENGPRLMTNLGTRVVVGSGYPGTGPVGNSGAAASATNKWMYATGDVFAALSDPETVNNYKEGIGYTRNDMTVESFRMAAVYFDPTIHYAAQVTVP